MPRSRPQLSITLPRNFTFHYTEEEPKTPPERQISLPAPPSPSRAGNAIRHKRRSRPGLTSLFPSDQGLPGSHAPIPTIETPLQPEPGHPTFQQRITEPAEGYLAPLVARKCMTLPRTPVLRNRVVDDWHSSEHQDAGESISRPMSSCSLRSNSSDESDGSLLSFPAGDGSCTSPESDAADPFNFPSMKKSQAKGWAALTRNTEEIQGGLLTKHLHVSWTPEMDKHLWSTYLIYLQDPTVTPFKTLPGTAPPLGVCHRVAREARRSWRLGQPTVPKASEPLSPRGQNSKTAGDARPNSPDTIRADRSGSNTPTAKGSTGAKMLVWPKSGSSTRRRLRYLCKSKSTFAPHYQRLMKSRSPSPFSSPRHRSCGQSRLSEVFSPMATASFSTRDIQLGLTTSTAATMRPDGPLAQLASGPQRNTPSNNEWFNEPPVPWASTPAIPSDLNVDIDEQDQPVQAPSLGSPFGFHTWGPSRSRQRVRPKTSRIQSTDASTMGPSLRSPLHLHDTFPYPGVQKRRARHQLEDELSPGGSSMQQELLESLFSTAPEGRHRRVRSRGFSLGDVTTPNPLGSLFVPPNGNDQDFSTTHGAIGTNNLEPPTTPSQIRRLGSPFHGISRSPRTPSRHMATTSLDSYEPFSSIAETLGQSNNIINT